MDPNEIKKKAELTQKFNASKQSFGKHKSDHQQAEIERIKDFFKSFFGSQQGYSVTERNGQVIASVANQNITLSEDEFTNRREPTHAVHFKLGFPDGSERQIGTLTTHDYVGTNSKLREKVSEEERIQTDMDYYDAMVNGNANVLTTYYLKNGQQKRTTFKTLDELFKAV